ncbi:MAG TPA: DUF763 domain-containing protein, partial [Polyangiaceae bacterium]
MGRTGTAMLPLHGGAIPPWLSARMAALGRVIAEAIALEYGRKELLRRLSHPGWFQAFGAVMGMDWHSSGITTAVVSALKRGLAPVTHELGFHVCGGRGRASRQTPAELLAVAEKTGLDGAALVRTSRLVAKVDSAAIQDGHQLYLHGFFLTDDGDWCVVQQGMSGETRTARRYHWLSESVKSFVDEPHAAIDGIAGPPIVNLTDARAAAAREAAPALVARPDFVLDQLARLGSKSPPKPMTTPLLPHLDLPAHHDVRPENIDMKRLGGALRAAAERGPADFPELLLTPGIGARTIFALALVADVVYGAPSRFSDPARHSLAHGGKDGHPYPVPLRVYDSTLGVLRRAVERAKLGNADKLAALERLDREARRSEASVERVDYEGLVDSEWQSSPEWEGRMVT